MKKNLLSTIEKVIVMCIVVCSTLQKLLIEFIMVSCYIAPFYKMPVKILRLMIDSYVRQSTRISWDNVYTNYFQLLNGVNQGGVLSAKLFTLYIDGLYTELIKAIRIWMSYK